MGIAAYNRGSRAISWQICAQFGCHGCVRCSEYKPTPRPADWGDKAKAKALARARRVLLACGKAGLPAPSEDMLTTIVSEREHVGERTGRAAARLVLGEINKS